MSSSPSGFVMLFGNFGKLARGALLAAGVIHPAAKEVEAMEISKDESCEGILQQKDQEATNAAIGTQIQVEKTAADPEYDPPAKDVRREVDVISKIRSGPTTRKTITKTSPKKKATGKAKK